MKKGKLLILLLFMLLLCTGAVTAQAASVLQTDVTAASDDCVLLGIEGSYITEIQAALDRINAIRLEACLEGVLNPSTGSALTLDDYVPIKWSSDLEYIARIRAAESGITMGHTRTNGKSCFKISSPNGIKSYGEVLAWNRTKSMLTGIEQWYDEKADWVNQTSGAVTGHYTAMIDPSNRYVGLGTFYTKSTYYHNTTAGEFSSITSGLDETQGSAVSDCIQLLEIRESYLTGYGITGVTSGKKTDTEVLSLTASAMVTSSLGTYKTTGLMPLSVSWTSSDSAVASVDANGRVIANYCGEATITASVDGTQVAGVTFTVNHTEETDAAVEATCTETGLTEGSHCSVCGTVLTAQTIVAAKGHTVVTDAAVAATCTETGLTEGSHCSACGTVLIAQTVVAAKGHTPVTDAAVAATCTKTGLTEGSHCSACGTVLTAQTTVAAKDHTVVTDAAAAATCTATGLTEGSHCSVCGETLTAQTTITALGHSWNSGKVTKAATVSSTGVRTYTCKRCGKTKTQKIAAAKPKKGKTYTTGVWKVKVTNAATNGKGTVTLVGTTKSKKSLKTLTIPDTVKIGKFSYRVTVIGKEALKGYKKLTTVTIGKYVKEIASGAFQNCTKLKTLTIKSKSLKTVGKNAISSIAKKAVIKVPSSSLKAYKKLFTSKTGWKKTMTIKK